MKHNFWELLWQSFQYINGVLLGILGICVSLLVLYAKKEENEQILCLLSKCKLFNINQIISVVYQDENGYESLIAIGEIINVQTDGKIQTLIKCPIQLESSRDIFDRLGNNEIVIKERIIIRPNIDKTLLTYF